MVHNPHATEEITRRLATIVMADVVGYSRMMGHDEQGTHTRVQRLLRDMIEPTIARYHGRLVKQRGDGFLSMFDSPVEAVRCAIIVQQSMVRANLEMPIDQAIRLRIGINLGDVIVEEDDIYGDGVNIAARLEQLAEPGNIFISGGVYEQVRYKLVCGFQSLGERRVKNIQDPVPTYRVLPDPISDSKSKSLFKLYRRHKRHGLLGLGGVVALLAGLFIWQRMPPTMLAQPNDPPVIAATAAKPIIPSVDPAAPPRTVERAPPYIEKPPPRPAEPDHPPASVPDTAVITPPAPHPPVEAQPVAPTPPPAVLPVFSEPDMVSIAGGTFEMGSTEDPSERPPHRVTIKPFMLSKYLITVKQWLACSFVGACRYTPTGNDDSPVTNISWNDAQQYVTWLSQTTKRQYRLPTEAEWEYAARGGTNTRYWWGNTIKSGYASCKGCGESTLLLKVGARPANPFGLFDISGGVMEWVQDCWMRDYKDAPVDGTAREKTGCASHVLRGGAWSNDQSDIRSASRDFYDAAVRYPTHGLRVARSP